MDIAEKKKEYDALTALANWVGYAATVCLIIGFLWLQSYNILATIGFIGMLAGTSLQLYARYHFGLIKNYYRWLLYQAILLVLWVGLMATVIILAP